MGLTVGFNARAEGDEPPQIVGDLHDEAAPAAKMSGAEKADAEIEKLTIDSEMADADALSYKEVAKENVSEEKSLKKEAGELKIHFKQVNNQSKQARDKAARAQKALEKQKIQIVELKKQIQRAEKSNAQEAKRQAALEKQLATAKEKAASLKAKNDDLQASIRSHKKANVKNERGLKKATAQVAQEKARQKKLRSEGRKS